MKRLLFGLCLSLLLVGCAHESQYVSPGGYYAASGYLPDCEDPGYCGPYRGSYYDYRYYYVTPRTPERLRVLATQRERTPRHVFRPEGYSSASAYSGTPSSAPEPVASAPVITVSSSPPAPRVVAPR